MVIAAILAPLKPVLGLLLAALLGGAIGIQRQVAQKPAGLRTHLLVALASCAITEVGRLTGDDRMAAAVLTGIGFLGAGAIVRSGAIPHGLTTAASLWTVAAIGVAVGFNNAVAIIIAVGGTLITLVALSFSDNRLGRMLNLQRNLVLSIVYDDEPRVLAAINDQCRAVDAVPKRQHTTEIVRIDTRLEASSDFHLIVPHHFDAESLLEKIAALPGVYRVRSADAVASS